LHIKALAPACHRPIVLIVWY